MSSMEKEKKKGKRKEMSPTLTSLPDDLIVCCFARVSRLYYPSLSLVSKRFGSLLVSPELYKARSLLGQTESCLYVCIEFDSGLKSKPSWFTLSRKPDQTKNKKNSSGGYVLAKVPISDFPPAKVSGLVAVGSSIYNICGESKSSSVLILDCRSHSWYKAPRFPVELSSLSASVFDRKIYVAGCYKDDDGFWKNTYKVFDTKTQIWDHMPPFQTRSHIDYCCNSACIDGKFHVEIGKGVVIAYDSKEGRWDLIKAVTGNYMDLEHTYCAINNVLYSGSNEGLIKWYDTKLRFWRNLMGLSQLPCGGSRIRSLADYGGKMVVLWDEEDSSSSSTFKKIWCAVVVLEKRQSSCCDYCCEVRGIVEWCDHVLTVPNLSCFIKGLATTV